MIQSHSDPQRQAMIDYRSDACPEGLRWLVEKFEEQRIQRAKVSARTKNRRRLAKWRLARRLAG